MLEAVNENREGCFGWAVEGVLEESGLKRVKVGECTHHHENKKNLVGKGKAIEGLRNSFCGTPSLKSGCCRTNVSWALRGMEPPPPSSFLMRYLHRSCADLL